MFANKLKAPLRVAQNQTRAQMGPGLENARTKQLARLTRISNKSAGKHAQMPMQRASDYSGRMLDHDYFGDSYDFKGARNNRFTYHHIIPENKLEDITKEFEAMNAYLSTRNDRNPERDGFYKRYMKDLLANSKAHRDEVRAKNTHYWINREIQHWETDVTLSLGQTRQFLAKAGEDMGAIFRVFSDHFCKPKMKEYYSDYAATSQDHKIIKRLLDTREIEHFLNKNQGEIESIIDYKFAQTPEQRRIYNFPKVKADTVAAVIELVNERPKKNPPSKGDLYKTLLKTIKRSDKYDYMARNYDYLGDPKPRNNGFLSRILNKSASFLDDDSLVEAAVQWNPGNIHRGPSSSFRLGPDSPNFNELLDDGGKRFEKAAQQLVSADHYMLLVGLNSRIDTYLQNGKFSAIRDDDTRNHKIANASLILKSMVDIQNMGTTGFREDQWEQIGQGNGAAMRLIPKDEQNAG